MITEPPVLHFEVFLSLLYHLKKEERPCACSILWKRSGKDVFYSYDKEKRSLFHRLQIQ